jgi:hypothetical protein
MVRPAADCLAGAPAFILGNGPFLPEDLTPLDGFFTIGVNRILLRYDPTVLMWFDSNIPDILGARLSQCLAVPFTNQQINHNPRWNGLENVGNSAYPVHAPLQDPKCIPVTLSSACSAAWWSMTLGCSPVYLLGMSGTYDGERTDFYGTNRFHERATLKRMHRATGKLLMCENVFPIGDAEALREITNALSAYSHERQWYVDRLAGVHPG